MGRSGAMHQIGVVAMRLKPRQLKSIGRPILAPLCLVRQRAHVKATMILKMGISVRSRCFTVKINLWQNYVDEFVRNNLLTDQIQSSDQPFQAGWMLQSIDSAVLPKADRSAG
ncbi:hypothetical protein C1J02_06550 [Sulfitobacter sp. SK011]|nr:hypothetical protein C1J02_06550 [Sulfitobacter sp. SK011]